MKPCPYCAEEIRDDAVKCRYCGEFLDDAHAPKRQKEAWYHSTGIIIVCLLAVGPLALPLVWFHPRYSLVTKVVVTAVMGALTVWLALALRKEVAYLRDLMEQLDEISGRRH